MKINQDAISSVEMILLIATIFLICAALSGCSIGKNTMSYEKTSPAGEKIKAKAMFGKELTADGLKAFIDLSEGRAEIEADRIETKSVEAIAADSFRIEATTEGAKQVIEGIGGATGAIAGEAIKRQYNPLP